MSNSICIVCGRPITGRAPVVDAHLDGVAQVDDRAHPECAADYARFCRWNARHGERRGDATKKATYIPYSDPLLPVIPQNYDADTLLTLPFDVTGGEMMDA